MNGFRVVVAAIATVFVFAVNAATIDIYDTWQGKAFEDTFTGFTKDNTYTLSQDFSITNSAGQFKETRMPRGGAVFDFSDGNHTLRTGSVKLYNADLKKPVLFSFKGGTWNVGKGQFQVGGWYNLPLCDVTYELDGAVITNISAGTTLVYGYGTNVQFIAKGGARYYGSSNYIELCPATKADVGPAGWGVSKLVEFREGSKFYTGQASVYDCYSTVTERPQNTVIRFTGNGTVATGTASGGPGNCDFYLGYRAPCYRLEVTDGALFNFRFFNIGGYSGQSGYSGDLGRSNTVYVAGGGKIHIVYGLSLGQAPGAGYNTFVVGDGGSYSNTLNAPINIGARSSFNSFIITNGTIYAQAIQIGHNAGVSNNLFRVSGPNAKLNLKASQLVFFKYGTGNTLELCDRFHYGTLDSTEWYFTGNADACTGNVFLVESGASITGRYVRIAQSNYSTNNLFRIGNAASVTAREITMENVKTSGNTFCISNGTANFTGQYGFSCSGTGNVFRIQGESPRVRYVGPDTGFVRMLNGVEVNFDLTGLSAGYSEPVFHSTQFTIDSNSKLTFKGVEEVSERLTSTTDFVLARVTTQNTTMRYTVADSVLEAARSSLPDRASLLLTDNGRNLILRVRPPASGLILLIK